ncbi:MAG: DNA-3-methyladenine glycosylase I [Chloroflexota bacterium]
MMEGTKRRCYGGPEDALMMRYHDEEWGVPVHDDRALFESLVLDGFQAGLSWKTILQKRQNFRHAFGDFQPEKVAAYGEADRKRLLADPGIVRNRLKIEAAISNAQRFLEVQQEFGTFDRFIWGFTGGKTLGSPRAEAWKDLPTKTAEAEAMSRELGRRGFSFVGPTICYAFMQAVGMVNDHLAWCFRAPKGHQSPP